MSKKESLTSIRALRKDAIHLRLANANLSCKGSKDAMARRLHHHLSAQSTPTSTGQRRSRSANQRTPLTPNPPASTVANRHQGRVATTTSQQPPLTRRTEHQLANDDEAVDSSGDESDDHRRRPPPTNSNGHQRPSRTHRRRSQTQPDRSPSLTRSRSPHQRRHGATRSLRQRGLSASSDTESGEHRPRHSRGASSSRSSSLSSSTSSLSSVQSSVRSSASSSPSWNHRPPSRRRSRRHLRGHHRRHHHHRRHGHSQRESHSPTPFVSCAPPPHNRIINKSGEVSTLILITCCLQ